MNFKSLSLFIMVSTLLTFSYTLFSSPIDNDEYLNENEISFLLKKFKDQVINTSGNIQLNKLIEYSEDLPNINKPYYWNGKLTGYRNTIPQLTYIGFSGNFMPGDSILYKEWLSNNSSLK